MNIPLYKPHIGHEEIEAVVETMKRGKLARGEEVLKFENEFALYVGKKHAIAVNSGTSGLHVLVRAVGWKRGDEVITTPFSYIASANCLLYEDVKPVFVDIDPSTLAIDPSKIESKITSRTRGILVVHPLGLLADQFKIAAIAKKHNLVVIEDVCEAIGRPSDKYQVGSVGTASVYGFHENKQMTSGGEGGMIVTDDDTIATVCRSMRDQGRSSGPDWINHVSLGFNFRMTEMQAACGRVQLSRLDDMLSRRNEIARRYEDKLKNIKGLTTPGSLSCSQRNWFLFFVIFDSLILRDQAINHLHKNDIGYSTNYFPPIYRFPAHKEFRCPCPVTESTSERLLALPMYFGMSDDDVDTVVSALTSVLQ